MISVSVSIEFNQVQVFRKFTNADTILSNSYKDTLNKGKLLLLRLYGGENF